MDGRNGGISKDAEWMNILKRGKPFCMTQKSQKHKYINVLAFAVCFSFGEFSLARAGYITGASIYPRWRRSLECAFLVKTKVFSASLFSVIEITSYNAAKSCSKCSGKNYSKVCDITP